MRFSDEESSSSSESEQDSGDEYTGNSTKKKRATSNDPGSRKPARKSKAPPKPLYIAEVTETATNGADTKLEERSKVENVDSNILAQIRKAIKLATHAGTDEAEAKLAMRMATKLMGAQNITQADLIENESVEERSNRAGHSNVKIISTANKQVKNQLWYGIASDAACEAFDVQTYSVAADDNKSLDWVFYGLADNTVAAALAFEMLHNQIEVWALEKKRELKGRTAGNSYRIGVSERVWKDAELANRQALKQAEENERKREREEAAAAEVARAAEIARLAMPPDTFEEESKPRVKVEDAPDHGFSKPIEKTSG